MTIRARILSRWGRGVTRHPLLTLVVCLVIAAGSVVLAITSLELHADRSDLVSGDLHWSRLYADYRQDFQRWDDLVLCFEGAPGDTAIDDLARRVAEELNAHEQVASADAGFLATEAGPRMWKVADSGEFDQALTWFMHARELAAQPGPAEALALFTSSLAGFEHQSSMLKGVETFIRPMLEGLQGRPAVFDLLAPIGETWQSLTTGSGTIRTVLVHMERDAVGGIEAVGEDLALVRDITARVVDDTAPGTDWGATGLPALEADETTQAIRDSTAASIIAFVLVTLMMLLVFKRVTLPLLAAGSLLVGMAWSFGWVVLSVGHLQLLSVVFSAILIGLGIDFVLHLLARLRVVHTEYDSLPDAMARSFRDAGPGLITGATTTALAFAATSLTDFKGVAEMGVIAGGGVILLLVAMLCVFPAALAIGGRWRQRIERVRSWDDQSLLRCVGWADRLAIPVLIAAGIVVVALLVPMSRVTYDSNILNLQPEGLESVRWQHHLEQDAGANIWSGLVLTSPDEAPSMIESLRAIPGVAGVSGMGMLFPPDAAQREADLAGIRSRPVQPVLVDDPPASLASTLQLIASGLRREAGTVPDATELATDIDTALQAWHSADEPTRTARYEAMSRSWRTGADALHAAATASMAPGMPDADELPRVLRESWVGADGQWLLRVEPVADDASILEPTRLAGFVESIRTVTPDVLGPPVQILESSRLITHAYRMAALYALIAVVVILLLDFRSFIDAGLAIAPVFIGFIGVFGIMGTLGMQVNFANLMVLPLIFGIGVDAGVHVVHRWRHDPHGMPAGLVGGTGQAITMTMATTIIGFGAMLIAEHRGIRSLSIVMVTGLAITWLACMLVLPAALRLRTRLRPPQT
ncbi:MAG: MMPL family transporter [Phycisphaerales bacterium]|nr:MMPL family transporter [Phycisphaerales bacterium]